MIIMFLAHSPISFKHMSFWCPSLEPHQTTHHSNISAWLRKVCSQIKHVYVNQFSIDEWLLVSYMYWQPRHSNQVQLNSEWRIHSTPVSKLMNKVWNETDVCVLRFWLSGSLVMQKWRRLHAWKYGCDDDVVVHKFHWDNLWAPQQFLPFSLYGRRKLHQHVLGKLFIVFHLDIYPFGLLGWLFTFLYVLAATCIRRVILGKISSNGLQM